MTPPSGKREFWVDYRPTGQNIAHTANTLPRIPLYEFIHVIEYSALTEARDHIEQLKETIGCLQDQLTAEEKHSNKLKAEKLALFKEAKEAKEEIEILNGSITRASLAHSKKDEEIEQLKEALKRSGE